MSPIAQFEESARTLWRSDLECQEKRRRLKAIRAGILRYVERLDDGQLASDADPWRARSFDRVRSYLTHLAADVEDLALTCERAAPQAA